MGGFRRVVRAGLVVGLIVGRIIIRPVNAVLGWIFRSFNRFFDGMTAVYGWSIGKALRLSALVLILYGGLLVLTWWMFRNAPTGFVPQQDMGRCMAGVQLPDSSSLERTKEVMLKVEKIARETPGVAHTIAICGTSFVQQANGPNFGSLFIILKPFAQRQKPGLKDEAIMATLRRRWTREVVDAKTVVFGAPAIPGISVAGGFKVIVEDRGGLGVNALQEQTDLLIGKPPDPKGKSKGSGLAVEPGLVNVSTQFRSGIPQLYLDIDRSKVAALGLAPDEVNQALQIYLGSSYVNSFNEFGRHWQVTLQAEGKFRSQTEDVGLIQVRNKWGGMVPVGTVARIRDTTGPIFINRYNLYVAAPITGGLKPGVNTGDVIAAVDRTADQVLTRSMKTDWTELMYLQIVEGNTTPPQVVFSLSVLFVFLALAALYESWTLPLAVILVVPLCVLCALIGVLYTGTAVNIFVQVGLVVLVGLACKNAILIVEFAREKHDAGMTVFDATQEASRLRLRPILMTSFAFILGVAPLVYASGAGAEMRRSLGTVVFSGMLGVTVFGVFLTPVFYLRDPGIRRPEAVQRAEDSHDRLVHPGRGRGGGGRVLAGPARGRPPAMGHARGRVRGAGRRPGDPAAGLLPPARARPNGVPEACSPASSSIGPCSPRSSRRCSSWRGSSAISPSRWRNIPRSPRPPCRSRPCTPAPMPRPSATPWPRPSRSRSAASRACSTCPPPRPTTAPIP